MCLLSDKHIQVVKATPHTSLTQGVNCKYTRIKDNPCLQKVYNNLATLVGKYSLKHWFVK